MNLIIDVINIENADKIDLIIFGAGLFITCTFILFKIFSKEKVNEEEQEYYSRHNLPSKNKKRDKVH